MEPPFRNPIQRHVMVAWYDDLGHIWQLLQKRLGVGELLPFGALRQIATDHDRLRAEGWSKPQ